MDKGPATGSAGNIVGSGQDSAEPGSISYRRLRSPKKHGQILHRPSLSTVDEVWKSNLEIRSTQAATAIGNDRLIDVQRLARSELIDLAEEYTRRYREVEPRVELDAIVMAGHQPELFHPGVWYKNFVLSNLGQRWGCTAINLVVDNDICAAASIRYPKLTATEGGERVELGTVEFDRPGPTVPYEARQILNRESFATFSNRVLDAVGSVVDSPLIRSLWPEVLNAAELISGGRGPRLGHAIAAGRHRLEGRSGLRTLEVPISWIAQTRSFAMFAKSILVDPVQFQTVYNEVLFEYRTVHKIRSSAHPVPELESENGWTESPFWIWRTDQPARRRLFVKRSENGVSLSDLTDWQQEFPLNDFVDSFQNLENESIAIRPKALMTTLFSRLVLSDLFLHGIGGAKYDQLTDVIANRFFQTQLPDYLTLSATMQMPFEREVVTRADVTAIERQIRELRYHPEHHVSNPSAEISALIKQKYAWTQGAHRGERSQEKHTAIESINRELVNSVQHELESLQAARKHGVRQLRAGEILGSREYSFCLFPESLIGDLNRLADPDHCPR